MALDSLRVSSNAKYCIFAGLTVRFSVGCQFLFSNRNDAPFKNNIRVLSGLMRFRLFSYSQWCMVLKKYDPAVIVCYSGAYKTVKFKRLNRSIRIHNLRETPSVLVGQDGNVFYDR